MEFGRFAFRAKNINLGCWSLFENERGKHGQMMMMMMIERERQTGRQADRMRIVTGGRTDNS